MNLKPKRGHRKPKPLLNKAQPQKEPEVLDKKHSQKPLTPHQKTTGPRPNKNRIITSTQTFSTNPHALQSSQKGLFGLDLALDLRTGWAATVVGIVLDQKDQKP